MNNDAQPYYPVAGELITENAVFTLIPDGRAPQNTTLLFVHAHPDDESSATGATIAALTAAGATVDLLTMTRGEMGEVIDPALKHLEAEHPANTDRGRQLGQLRTRELKAALTELGVRDHLFLGQGPSALPGERTHYRDSGMAWGSDGRAAANPLAADDCLTHLPLKPQAEAVAATIRAIRPDVIVTYDADGGYGHPDHKRTHEVVMAALDLIAGTTAEPIAVWGIEGQPQETDTRQQVVIRGKIEGKREAMRAHATQITITGPTTFEYSNKVPQPITAVETYRKLQGQNITPPPTASATDEITEAPGPINSIITASALGLISGFAGTMYHTQIWYISKGLWLPWGLALALLTVYFAATWAAIHTEKNWAATLVGAVAFLLTGTFAFAKGNSLLVYINPINPPGIVGTLWAFGILAVTALSIISASRYRRKNK
ncbi:PIG-L family deacetylase [Rothia sp. P4278]|uniref:PIG-L family deacetylase n=1 Tax=Rothia sp. P4278 TaxID=3402658 RepID=UPI003AEB730C